MVAIEMEEIISKCEMAGDPPRVDRRSNHRVEKKKNNNWFTFVIRKLKKIISLINCNKHN